MRAIAMALMWAMLSGAWAAAPPQNVFRCGPDGRVFSDRPCADGTTKTVNVVDDTPSADAQHDAKGVAARDRRLASQLVKQREAREAEAHARSFGGIRSGGVGAIDTPNPSSSISKRKKTRETPHPTQGSRRQAAKSTSTHKVSQPSAGSDKR